MAHKEILVPDIGTTTEVSVIEVFVKPGDQIEIDSPLITLESDKASMEIPASEAGIVKSVNIKLGDKIKAGSVILTLDALLEEGAAQALEKNSEKFAEKPDEKSDEESKDKTDNQTVSEKSAPEKNLNNQNIYTSPVVRRLAHELEINLENLTGTGKKNRLQKEDLLNYIKQAMHSGQSDKIPLALPLPPDIDFGKFGETQIKALSKIKKLTAINLHRNWILVPHVTQFDEADITSMEAFRKSQATNGLKLTPLVFIMKAVVAALKKFPHFNASLDASGNHIILKKYFHIGVAVDTSEGLVVPVIHDVDRKSLSELAAELAAVSEKARQKKLLPKDMEGSCFTISSLGGIGGTAFTPIVNLPDAAILGVSKAQYKPVYQEGEFVPRLMLPLSLSYDHRIIDGAEGARFIVQLSRYLSEIQLLLL